MKINPQPQTKVGVLIFIKPTKTQETKEKDRRRIPRKNQSWFSKRGSGDTSVAQLVGYSTFDFGQVVVSGF